MDKPRRKPEESQNQVERKLGCGPVSSNAVGEVREVKVRTHFRAGFRRDSGVLVLQTGPVGRGCHLGQVPEEDLPFHRDRNSTYHALVMPSPSLSLDDLVQERDSRGATGTT